MNATLLMYLELAARVWPSSASTPKASTLAAVEVLLPFLWSHPGRRFSLAALKEMSHLPSSVFDAAMPFMHSWRMITLARDRVVSSPGAFVNYVLCLNERQRERIEAQIRALLKPSISCAGCLTVFDDEELHRMELNQYTRCSRCRGPINTRGPTVSGYLLRGRAYVQSVRAMAHRCVLAAGAREQVDTTPEIVPVKTVVNFVDDDAVQEPAPKRASFLSWLSAPVVP